VASSLFPFVFTKFARLNRGGGWTVFILPLLVVFSRSLAQESLLPDNLAPPVRPDPPQAELRQFLTQAAATAAAEQWDETIDLVQQVQARASGHMLPLDSGRYVSLAEICQRQLATLPPAGLARYRQRYDEQAEQALERARVARDLTELTRVTEQWFATSSGDDALWLLGEWHLEQGQPGRAREYWSRLHRAALGNITAAAAKSTEMAATSARLIYPDTKFPLSEIRARLLLTLIAEARWDAAERELKKFRDDFPAATGELGGRRAPWTELLGETLAAARAARISADTIGGVLNSLVETTFAGNARRNFTSPDRVRPRVLTWSAPWSLPSIWQSDVAAEQRLGIAHQRLAEDPRQMLAMIPVLTNRYVLACDDLRVYALDKTTGDPAWPSPQRRPGEIYFAAQLGNPGDASLDNSTNPTVTTRTITGYGVPRFTITVQGSLALARLGSPVTLPLPGQAKQHASEVVCLDLERQGIPLWTLRPPGDNWIFEGTPVCDVNFVYQLLRYVDARPQWHVACYELMTGVQRWRTLIGSGEAQGRGQVEELSHTLMTLAEGRLYFCTNQGTVAALDAASGYIAWLAPYPRGKTRNAVHWRRDLTPPVYNAGTIYIAPADTPSILALDAVTGEIRWSNVHAGEMLHLLGTAAGHLIATGRTVRWMELETGRIAQQWPDHSDRNQGADAPLGRGILAGEQILWPQRGGLTRLHQRVATAGHGEQIVATPQLPWSTINQELSGGNLLVHGEQLLIATGKQFWSLGPEVAMPRASKNTLSATHQDK
jgi:outer membrane protein assembly factor BamB